MQREARFGPVKVDGRDLVDAVHTVQQRIAMHDQHVRFFIANQLQDHVDRHAEDIRGNLVDGSFQPFEDGDTYEELSQAAHLTESEQRLSSHGRG